LSRDFILLLQKFNEIYIIEGQIYSMAKRRYNILLKNLSLHNTILTPILFFI